MKYLYPPFDWSLKPTALNRRSLPWHGVASRNVRESRDSVVLAWPSVAKFATGHRRSGIPFILTWPHFVQPMQMSRPVEDELTKMRMPKKHLLLHRFQPCGRFQQHEFLRTVKFKSPSDYRIISTLSKILEVKDTVPEVMRIKEGANYILMELGPRRET